MRFEEKKSHGEKKDKTIGGDAEKRFPQGRPDLSTVERINTLCSLSRGKDIAIKKTGADDQKDFDWGAGYQLFSRSDDDSSERKTQENV